MLRPAQAYALGAELPSLPCVRGRIGVGAHVQGPQFVGPRQDLLEILGELGVDERELAFGHPAAAPLDGYGVPRLEGLAVYVDLSGFEVYLYGLAAGHGGLPEAARHDGRVAGHAPRAVRMPWP